MTTHPVPDPAAHAQARYDTDPDALAWARAKVQHQLDRLAAFEQHATETGQTEKARGLSAARRSTEQMLLGVTGCVVGAFDARRPEMLAAPSDADGASAADTLPEWLNHRYGRSPHGWDAMGDDERAYWVHEAAAVRRAVARGGFETGGGV